MKGIAPVPDSGKKLMWWDLLNEMKNPGILKKFSSVKHVKNGYRQLKV